jgi:hypothetical protein
MEEILGSLPTGGGWGGGGADISCYPWNLRGTYLIFLFIPRTKIEDNCYFMLSLVSEVDIPDISCYPTREEYI